MPLKITPLGLFGLVAVAAMLAALFLPFITWGEDSLTLVGIALAGEGGGWLLGLVGLAGLGAALACLRDDTPGLVPLGVIYLVYPTYAFHNVADYVGEDIAVAAGFPPLAGEPAALGYYVIFLATYAAIAIGLADWLTGRGRRLSQRMA
jgi:hypothetical protein